MKRTLLEESTTWLLNSGGQQNMQVLAITAGLLEIADAIQKLTAELVTRREAGL